MWERWKKSSANLFDKAVIVWPIEILLGHLSDADHPFESQQLTILWFLATRKSASAWCWSAFLTVYYTIPRTVRELQLCLRGSAHILDYTIPRTVRELQPVRHILQGRSDYTIPRTVRELQHVHPSFLWWRNYTIPRTVRELQPFSRSEFIYRNYTIPRTVRELQLAAHSFFRRGWLYHTKNCQGATTVIDASPQKILLYHTGL